MASTTTPDQKRVRVLLESFITARWASTTQMYVRIDLGEQEREHLTEDNEGRFTEISWVIKGKMGINQEKEVKTFLV